MGKHSGPKRAYGLAFAYPRRFLLSLGSDAKLHNVEFRFHRGLIVPFEVWPRRYG